jgi:hypothetical protein
MPYPDNILWYAPSVSTGGRYCTANLAIRRHILSLLRGFDERLHISHEDVNLGTRIQKSGFRSAYVRDALVKHPPLRITLAQAWQVAIQQQCQSFVLQHRDSRLCRRKFTTLIYIVAWSAKFCIRTCRLEMSCRLPGHWRRPVQAILLRLMGSPLAILRIWQAPDLQVLANQQWR